MVLLLCVLGCISTLYLCISAISLWRSRLSSRMSIMNHLLWFDSTLNCMKVELFQDIEICSYHALFPLILPLSVLRISIPLWVAFSPWWLISRWKQIDAEFVKKKKECWWIQPCSLCPVGLAQQQLRPNHCPAHPLQGRFSLCIRSLKWRSYPTSDDPA